MGCAVAAEAAARGAEVVLVAGPTAIDPPPVAELVRVRSAREMHDAVMGRAGDADVVVMAAAVADYTPADGAAVRKIEKGGAITVTLARTTDILAELGARRGGSRRPLLVGFAAQTGDPVPAARRKLDAKQVDLIVANDVTAPEAGFDVPTNQVTLVSADRADALPVLPKREVARVLLDRVERLLAADPVAAAPESRP
jgi:phosphopantothenoylcysteine decarboxylase/phosphopantothenate--cysteine ligase